MAEQQHPQDPHHAPPHQQPQRESDTPALAGGGPNIFDVVGEMMQQFAALEGVARPEDLIDELSSQEHIDLLQEYEEKCTLEGQYKQAELAHQILDRIHERMEAKHLEEVNNRQLTERLGLEKAHMSEFSEFTLFWDAKEAEYDENSGLLVLQTRDKHSTELQEYFDELERRFDRPKPSPELLNMRRIEEALAKQKKFAEAEVMRGKIAALEEIEAQRFVGDKSERIAKLTKRVLKRQQTELRALEMRIRSGKRELQTQRAAEFQRLAKRYKNIKQGLLAAQGIERARTDAFLSKHAQRLHKRDPVLEEDSIFPSIPQSRNQTRVSTAKPMAKSKRGAGTSSKRGRGLSGSTSSRAPVRPRHSGGARSGGRKGTSSAPIQFSGSSSRQNTRGTPQSEGSWDHGGMVEGLHELMARTSSATRGGFMSSASMGPPVPPQGYSSATSPGLVDSRQSPVEATPVQQSPLFWGQRQDVSRGEDGSETLLRSSTTARPSTRGAVGGLRFGPPMVPNLPRVPSKTEDAGYSDESFDSEDDEDGKRGTRGVGNAFNRQTMPTSVRSLTQRRPSQTEAFDAPASARERSGSGSSSRQDSRGAGSSFRRQGLVKKHSGSNNKQSMPAFSGGSRHLRGGRPGHQTVR